MKHLDWRERKLWAEYREKHTVPRWANCSKKEAQEIRHKWNIRDARRVTTRRPLSPLQRWIDRNWSRALRATVDALLTALPRLNYSMGSCYEIAVEIRGGSRITLATRDERREYPRSSRFRARHGELILRLTPSDLMRAQVVEGVITFAIRLPRDKGECLPCQWIEFVRQSTGSKALTPRMVSGFLCGRSHGRDRDEAIELARLAGLQYRAASPYQVRRDPQARATFRAKCQIYRFRRVTRSVSTAVGNCKTGTEAWLQRAGLSGRSCTLEQLVAAIARCPSARAENVVHRVLRGLPLLPARLCDVQPMIGGVK